MKYPYTTLLILVLAGMVLSQNTLAQSLYANDSGDIGLGILSPDAPMHIYREDGTSEFLFLESNQAGGAQDRPMMFLTNNGGIRFEFRDTNRGAGWRFQAQTGGSDRFEVTKVGTGEIEYSFRPNGNLFISGNLFTNSDVNAKENITPVSGESVLERLSEVNISEWSYKDASDNRHMGPMAQDFYAAFGLGVNNTTITATDMAGVSLAAIKELTTRNAQLEQRNQALEATNVDLETRLRAVETLIGQLLPQTAQH